MNLNRSHEVIGGNVAAGRVLRGLGGLWVTTLLLMMVFAQPAAAAPLACRIGTYVGSLSEVNPAEGTFKADFWIWANCPKAAANPLDTMEFVNGTSVTTSLGYALPRGNERLTAQKVSGTFRQSFALADYPFDDEHLTIEIEESAQDIRDLIYVADNAQSGLDPRIDIPGWKLGKLTVAAKSVNYPTTFGDPTLKIGSSDYAGLTLQLDTKRSVFTNFIKSTFTIYIAVLLALVSLVVNDGRTGLSGASMFTVVLSFVSVDGIVGPHDGLYLLEQLHICALLSILAATGWGVYSLIRQGHGEDANMWLRRDRTAALIMLVVFASLNFALVRLNVPGGS